MNEKPPYELHHGPVDSPEKHVNFCIYQGRQTGKTHKLLMSIPDKPIVLVVHKHAHGKELLRTLKELRPEYDTLNITLVTYDINGNWTDKIRGRRQPIYFDNCVLDILQINYVKHINNVLGERKDDG